MWLNSRKETNQSKRGLEFLPILFIFFSPTFKKKCLLTPNASSNSINPVLNYAFELRCWRRLLRIPWTTRRSNQFILKETSPGCSLEGLMLKLKLQYFGHLMRRGDSSEKTLMLGKIEGRRRRGRQRMRWLDGITDSMDRSLSNSGS